MNIDYVRRDVWLVAGLALLLVLDLLILAWFSFPSVSGSIRIGGASLGRYSYGGPFTATDAPDGWLGVLAVISSVLILVDVLIEQFSPHTAVPAIRGSRPTTRFVLAVAAGLFMALKLIFHLGHFSNLGLGFWLGAVIVAALMYFSLQARNATTVAPARTTGPAAGTGSAGPPPV